MALGLTGHPAAGRQMLQQLARFKHQDEYAGFLCVGMALLPYRRASKDLLGIVSQSVRRPGLLQQASVALGKMGDEQVTKTLLDMLQDRRQVTLAKVSGIASALSLIGDRRTLKPLVAMLFDNTLTPLTRAFAAVALGGVADRSALPWNSKIGQGLNYRAAVETLTRSGNGVLDIL